MCGAVVCCVFRIFSRAPEWAGVGAGFGSAFSRLLSDATSTKSSSSCSIMTRYDMDMAWFAVVREGDVALKERVG